MNKNFVSPRKAAQILDIHPNTLRAWEKNNLIEVIKSSSGYRKYNIEKFIKDRSNQDINKRINICYCRVSGIGQKEDLNRQANFLKEQFPEHTLIKDVGSGLNYKRKGLKTILDYAIKGVIGQVVVAYKDRLCRFGFELIKYIIEESGGEVLVLNCIKSSPEEEMVRDLTSIIHIFSCRLYGIRKYKTKIKEDCKVQEMPIL